MWEPGTLRRQTRAELCTRWAERQAEAHETHARKSSLSWRARFHLHLPGHGSVDWQWGWVGLPEASRDGIHRLTLPEVTEERNPSMTKHELPTSNQSLMKGGPQPESGACYEGGTASVTQRPPFLTLRPPKASLVPWRNSPTAVHGWLASCPCPSPAEPEVIWGPLSAPLSKAEIVWPSEYSIANKSLKSSDFIFSLFSSEDDHKICLLSLLGESETFSLWRVVKILYMTFK